MIIIKYPPDFDGELHVKVTPKQNAFTYEFTHNNKSGTLTEWQALVKAAIAIVEQDNRKQ